MAARLVRCIEGHIYDVDTHKECPICSSRAHAENPPAASTAPANTDAERPAIRARTAWERFRLPGATVAVIAVVGLLWISGVFTSERKPADPPRPEAWRFVEAPTAGGGGEIPTITYVGGLDRGFRMSAECRGSGPSVYISIDNPGADLQQLRFDTPIPVTFRIDGGQTGKSPNANSVQVTARLSDGYIPATNRVRLGIGLGDGVAVTDMLARDINPAAARLIVEVARTSAAFDLTGASGMLAKFKRTCEARKL